MWFFLFLVLNIAHFNPLIIFKSGEPTPNRTGLFEVKLVDGPVLWSKKETEKFPTSDADYNHIFDLIRKSM